MKKYLPYTILLFILFFKKEILFAQHQTKKEITVSPIPVRINTGNQKQDSVNYLVAKEKWIEEVLFLYRNKLTAEQINKAREILRKENPEDVIHGKILLAE